MTVGRRYALGVAAVAATVLGFGVILPADTRSGVRIALGVALAIQGPLGWYLVRAIGSERFLAVWALGIAARGALVAACGLSLAPRFGLPLEATLLTLVGVLVALVLVEALVARPRLSSEAR